MKKNSYFKKSATLLVLSVFSLTSCEKKSNNANIEIKQPAVKMTCTVSESDFSQWFVPGSVNKEGKIKPNAVAIPANSLQDLPTTGDFYKWSWQMFLWQTSPESDGLVFNQPPFYDVDAEGNLTSNESNKPSYKRLRATKKNNSGEDVESTGQAGPITGVLMTQSTGITPNGSLVYYAIHVNQAYAYMASAKNASSPQLQELTQFPTTSDEIQAIVEFAQDSYGVTISDQDALTMELKSSWVKVEEVKDASKYLTITADIPKYTKVSDKLWSWDGESLENNVKLACIGYHLVGSTANHPEMVWATFEHISNAPDNNFYYVNADDKVTQKVNWDANGHPMPAENWLLMSSSGTLNASGEMHMINDDPLHITATKGNTISASNTARTHPWGSPPNEKSAVNNTEIISLNQNIQSMLNSHDPRKNYFLVGATWTKNGVPGSGLQLPVVAGSKVLANATMETYFQSQNCFDCHKLNHSDQVNKIDGLSHIFSGVKPLAKPE